MFIKFSKLKPRAWGWNWRKDQRVLLVGLWFLAVGFDFGLKRSDWYKHFFHNCSYCNELVRVQSREQVVKWHPVCRERGRRAEWLVLKAVKREAVEYAKRFERGEVSLWERLMRKPNIPTMVRP